MVDAEEGAGERGDAGQAAQRLMIDGVPVLSNSIKHQGALWTKRG